MVRKMSGKNLIDILFINGYRRELVKYPPPPAYFPVGISFIAQAVEDAGFSYIFTDVNVDSDERILRCVKKFRPRYIGLGTMSYCVEENFSLLQKCREILPET
jgi:hypothetical protein